MKKKFSAKALSYGLSEFLADGNRSMRNTVMLGLLRESRMEQPTPQRAIPAIAAEKTTLP